MAMNNLPFYGVMRKNCFSPVMYFTNKLEASKYARRWATERNTDTCVLKAGKSAEGFIRINKPLEFVYVVNNIKGRVTASWAKKGE